MRISSHLLAVLCASVALARPPIKKHSVDNISKADMPSRSIALCPQDQWRPLSPYKSTAFPNPWWFLPDADQANKDNYDATHPSLPPGIVLPVPLLPTDNVTIQNLYDLATETYEADLVKQVRP